MGLNRQGGRWLGGYVSVGEGGRKTFVIERRVGGERFHVSTRCHTERAALKQLERFEADPLGYLPQGEAPAEKLLLTDELTDEFWKWSTGVRGNTEKHANEMDARLSDWIEDLGENDLRHVTLRDHIKPALEKRKTCRQHRIIALKSFYAWLRKEKHLLTHREDPTLDMPVPGAAPEKFRRRKALALADVLAVLGKLDSPYRECLLLLARTGWHVTELERFIRDKEAVLRGGDGTCLAIASIRHKSGDWHETRLTDPAALAAAEFLRQRREVPRKLNEKVKAACVLADVKPAFTLGVLRHSVATWAVESGASPKAVAEFLGHRSPETTKRYYIDARVPPAAVPLPEMVIPPREGMN